MTDTSMVPRKRDDGPLSRPPLVDEELADQLLGKAAAEGVELLGPDGLLSQVTFEPQIVRKGQTRLDGFNERIIALYARGMSTRDIRAHLREIYGGVADVCIVCCDGLTGLPDAIGVVWPQAVVQLCVVHLIRASLRYASRKYWAPLSKDLRAVYTAADQAAAAAALETFAGKWEDRYPAIVRLWRAHWSEFTPFLAFPPEVRRVIYTTNLIESMNARLRKVTVTGASSPPSRPRSRCSTWRSVTWRSSAARTPGCAVPGGNRRCRRSRSTSTGGSRPHETATVTYTDGRTLPSKLVRTRVAVDAVEGLTEVGGQGVGGGDGVVAGLDFDRAVAAGGADGLADRPARLVLDPAADR
jgi:hypothetical protein